MKAIISLCMMGVLALGLNGCMESKEAPSCSEEQVKAMVKEIYLKHMKEGGKDNILAQVFLSAAPQHIVMLKSARAVAYDEKIMLRSCKAEAVFDGNRTSNIAYTVQLDENDKDKMYVELQLDFLETLMQQGLMNQFMKEIK